MGQKINPTGFRLPVTRDWSSRWYVERRDFSRTLVEDLKVREFLLGKLKNASVSRILIERTAGNARVTIYSARPGVVIGKQGQDIEVLKDEVHKMMGVAVHINIEEVRRPELDAQLIAEGITQQLEKRVMFRRAMKRAMQNAMRTGALGIKVMSSGRLNGAEIARTEWYREGRVPLHTLRANIDYGFSEANTTYGVIGVKVWVYTGDEVASEAPKPAEKEERRARRPASDRPARRTRRPRAEGEAASEEAKPARRAKKADDTTAKVRTRAPKKTEKAAEAAEPAATQDGE
ncbi:MAG TPA: 30S ribosomal protein S3 [Sutterella sp.]|nr:30S ribosomal protein S3 [Sutterella sp.]